MRPAEGNSKFIHLHREQILGLIFHLRSSQPPPRTARKIKLLVQLQISVLRHLRALLQARPSDWERSAA